MPNNTEATESRESTKLVAAKIVAITGGNTGMGKASALSLARLGWRVYILCRDPRKAQAACEQIQAESGNSQVSSIVCDLASMASIRSAAAELGAVCPRLDVLICNAGMICLDRRETAEGHEAQFGVNHLGHFLLVNLLLPQLRAAKNSRIVIVSSGAHVIGRMDFSDIAMRRTYSAFKAYSRSKLANLLFCFALARRLAGRVVSVNALHPGAVGTEMGVDRRTGFGKGLLKFLSLFFLSPEEGSRTALYLASDPSLEGRSGLYYYKQKPHRPSPRALDVDAQERLWKLSCELCSLPLW